MSSDPVQAVEVEFGDNPGVEGGDAEMDTAKPKVKDEKENSEQYLSTGGNDAGTSTESSGE